MTTALDVASYILTIVGSTTAMKLQKLVYYSQAWFLVWKDRPLFDAKIEAWANGPVLPELYDKHRGLFTVNSIEGGNAATLTAEEQKAVRSVVEYYNPYTAQELSDLTHLEDPWMEAREGHQPGDRCSNEITPRALHEYYSSIN